MRILYLRSLLLLYISVVGESTLKPLTYQERNQPGAPQVTNGSMVYRNLRFNTKDREVLEIRLNLEAGFIQEFPPLLGLM